LFFVCGLSGFVVSVLLTKYFLLFALRCAVCEHTRWFYLDYFVKTSFFAEIIFIQMFPFRTYKTNNKKKKEKAKTINQTRKNEHI